MSSVSVRRVLVAVVTVLTALAVDIGPSTAAPCRPFRSSGTSSTTVIGASVRAEGRYRATHLGTGTAFFEATLSGGTATTLTYTGTHVYIAANGDRLEGTLVGTAGAPSPSGQPAPYEFVVTVTGGTGRFSDATGSFTHTGTNAFLGFQPGSTTERYVSVGAAAGCIRY